VAVDHRDVVALDGRAALQNAVLNSRLTILAFLHMQTADDLFGTPQGSPRTDKLIATSIQWAKRIMEKIDDEFGKEQRTHHADDS
jgi:hypothetical protein